MAKVTKQEIKEICELYDIGEKVEVIARRYNISPTRVSSIAQNNGCVPRKPRKNSVSSVARKCPNCRKIVDVKGAKFCPFCASDIRSSRDIAVEKLYAIRKMVMLLPENCRNEFEEATNMAIKELEKDV